MELLIEDDVCKPEIATNTATKLVSAGADAVIGHICSGATKAALGIYKDAGIPVMSPSATNPALTQSGEYPNFFRTIASDDAQARTQVDFALTTLKAKKIAVLHDKGDYGKGLAEYARNFIEASGQAEVVLFEGVTPGAVDYSAVVQKIKRSGADAVIFGGYHPEASKIVAQMRKKRMNTLRLRRRRQGRHLHQGGRQRRRGGLRHRPGRCQPEPAHHRVPGEVRQAEGTDPGAFFHNALAATLALPNAIAKAGSTEPKAIAQALRTE